MNNQRLKIPVYQVDAFADRPSTGNPAAVCPLKRWLSDEAMQAIAGENNLSETAFFIPTQQGFHLRWFTPTTEVDLCGHATLAAAFVLFHCLHYAKDTVLFETRSGMLQVSRSDDGLVMDFPAHMPSSCALPAAIAQAFSSKPLECLKAEDYLVVFQSEAEIVAAQPDISSLATLDLRGVIITAASHHHDFVSRFFAPHCGIDEDPVTGSAHTQLAPYWSAQLKRNTLQAQQLSARGGQLVCEVIGNRVMITGKAVLYMQGEILW